MIDPYPTLIEENYFSDIPPMSMNRDTEHSSQTDEDEERPITENEIVDRCPVDGSDQIKLFTTKANHTILRCAICSNYFCPNCKQKLDKKALNTRKSVILCNKCQTEL